MNLSLKKSILIGLGSIIVWLLIVFIPPLFFKKEHVHAYKLLEETCKITYYTNESDGLKKGDKGFGITFTGIKTRPGILAIDPVYFSKKLGLPYSKHWHQHKQALAPIFWNTIWIDINTHKTFLARDVGGMVRGAHLDIFLSQEQYRSRKKKLNSQPRKFMIIYFDSKKELKTFP